MDWKTFFFLIQVKNWTKKIDMTAMGKFQDKSRTFGKFKEISGLSRTFQDKWQNSRISRTCGHHVLRESHLPSPTYIPQLQASSTMIFLSPAMTPFPYPTLYALTHSKFLATGFADSALVFHMAFFWAEWTLLTVIVQMEQNIDIS